MTPRDRSAPRPRYFLPDPCALFAQGHRMLRLALPLAILLAGCAPGDDRDAADDAEEVPIGPGSDSTTLLPPDTPMTSRPPTAPPPDSLALPTT